MPPIDFESDQTISFEGADKNKSKSKIDLMFDDVISLIDHDDQHQHMPQLSEIMGEKPPLMLDLEPRRIEDMIWS